VRPADRVIGRLGQSGEAVDDYKGGGPAGMRRREQDAREAPASERDEDGPFGAGGVQDGANVVHEGIERLHLLDRDGVRDPTTALVEADQPAELGQPAEEAEKRGLVPLRLDRMPELGDEENVGRALTKRLERDVDVPGSRV
jgi:hypothetical protein